MKRVLLAIIGFVVFTQACAYAQKQLEIVATLNIRPGNVAVSPSGRVFSTLHPLGSRNLQLIEIKGEKAYLPYPSADMQKNESVANDSAFDTPLGLTFDKNGLLWVIDMGQELGKTRLWSININTKKIVRKIDIPLTIAPAGSFIQDLVVDSKNGWAYLADIANPGIIAVDLKAEKFNRFSAPQFQSEDIDMVIDGKLTYFGGKPARVGINPITLSKDAATVYFGAMNGRTWYSIDAGLLKKGNNDAITNNIKKVGNKPISDGAGTDPHGNHLFTNLADHAISRLDAKGNLVNLIKDPKLNWPDNLSIAANGYIYISVNQLNATPAFTGGADEGKGPYHIYRFKYEK